MPALQSGFATDAKLVNKDSKQKRNVGLTHAWREADSVLLLLGRVVIRAEEV